MELSEIETLGLLLDTIKLTEFSVDDLRKTIALKKELKQISKDLNELKIEVVKKFGIEPIPETGRYEYKGHKESIKIEKDILEINKGPYIIKSELNFITFEKLKSSLKEDHNTSDVSVLAEFLVNK